MLESSTQKRTFGLLGSGAWSLALIVAAALGCAKKTDVPAEVPPPVVPQQAAQAEELLGTWESNCAEAELFGLSENSTLTVDPLRMTKLMRYHSDGACGGTAVEVQADGDYSAGAEIRPKVREIDITISAIRVRPATAAGAQLLNIAGFCGYTNWEEGQTKDVTADSGKENCFPKVPQKLFDIYSVDAGKLTFGKGEDLTDASRRPTELDPGAFYTKTP